MLDEKTMKKTLSAPLSDCSLQDLQFFQFMQHIFRHTFEHCHLASADKGLCFHCAERLQADTGIATMQYAVGHMPRLCECGGIATAVLHDGVQEKILCTDCFEESFPEETQTPKEVWN